MIELPGREAVVVTPHRLDGVDREQAWQRSLALRSAKAHKRRAAGRRRAAQG